MFFDLNNKKLGLLVHNADRSLLNYSSPSTVTININGLNDSPVATAQTIEVIEQTKTNITLSGNDPDNDPLKYSILTLPENGILFQDDM